MDTLTSWYEGMMPQFNKICEGNMMPEACDNNDRKGLMESPCDDASRYGDGTLRRALQWFRMKAAYNSRTAERIRRRTPDYPYDGDAYDDKAMLYSIAAETIEEALKQRACSAGGRTPTSTPSP
jgi:hypothetical protein